MKTICAISTAQGGAIGIVRISGPEAVSAVNAVFSKDISSAEGYTMHYGHIPDIDDVIVSVWRAPRSYTGEDTVEISCHGSGYILQQVMQLLVDNGCTPAGPGEFTQRAFLNGKLDLSQAEAVADLIASQNASQHHAAMQQMRGGVSRELRKLRDRLLHLTSLLELELDFSDHEDLEFADRGELTALAQQIRTEIGRLSDSFAQGNAIKMGIPVAIIGAPNVGKSTLLNALLRDDRAIVSDIQGTTRDVIEDTVTIDGYLFRFIDTAGIRKTADTVEQMGIDRSLKASEKARIVILLTEPGVPFADIRLSEGQQAVRIVNKTRDFSALNGAGIEELERRLVDMVKISEADTGSALLITNQRHKAALDLALRDICRAADALKAGISGDLAAEDLRLCVVHLSEIVGGEITPDEVLGNIFSHFCVGK